MHHNFPGQFIGIGKWLVENNNEVTFICDTNFLGWRTSGIKVITNENKAKNKANKGDSSEQIACAKRFKETMKKIKNMGYAPNIIISHSGWGCGLYAKSIFKKSKLITYSEWWFKLDGMEYDYHNTKYISYSEETKEKLYLRNLTMAAELSESDKIVSPTNWQRKQLPKRFKEQTHVIHEGVDTDFYRLNLRWKTVDKFTITYATRGMEPMRGFPEMILAMKKILAKYANVELLIAGEDKICYGGKLLENTSYGEWAKKVLSKEIFEDKVKFLGTLSKIKYARLLKMSDLHLYLTRPYVASWSLVEAMASGCCIVATDIETVNEILPMTKELRVDHRDKVSLETGIEAGINISDEKRRSISLANRNEAVRRFSRKESLKKWTVLFGN